MTSDAVCKHIHCDRDADGALGLCSRHYQRWRIHKGQEGLWERSVRRLMRLHLDEMRAIVAEEKAKALAEYGMSQSAPETSLNSPAV